MIVIYKCKGTIQFAVYLKIIFYTIISDVALVTTRGIIYDSNKFIVQATALTSNYNNKLQLNTPFKVQVTRTKHQTEVSKTKQGVSLYQAFLFNEDSMAVGTVP